MSGRQHTDREYEGELRSLREQILLMGAKVEELVAASMKALVDRDSDLARRMMEFDSQINMLEMETDDLCLRILARRQPVASDLRFLTTALKLVTDLERIGDLGVNICERVVELNTEPPLRPYVDLAKMAETSLGMVRDALDAFVGDNAELAQQVVARDQVVDAYYAQIFRELLTYMMENPRNIFRATRIQSIAKYIERIGDHATNLSEMVVFMVRGKDIRHRPSARGLRPAPHPRGILFLCLRNSARSQMAEALARSILPASTRVFSAGSRSGERVHPLALKVLEEMNVDTTGLMPKAVESIPTEDIDVVITLCPEEIYVKLRREQRLERWDIADPDDVNGSEQEKLEAFRSTRDTIRERMNDLATRI
jgi:phosphate transport system protein